MPWHWVRAIYRDMKNEDGRYNANAFMVIIYFLPVAAVFAILPDVIFLPFTTAVKKFLRRYGINRRLS